MDWSQPTNVVEKDELQLDWSDDEKGEEEEKEAKKEEQPPARPDELYIDLTSVVRVCFHFCKMEFMRISYSPLESSKSFSALFIKSVTEKEKKCQIINYKLLNYLSSKSNEDSFHFRQAHPQPQST